MEQPHATAMEGIKKSLKIVEKQIRQIVQKDPSIKKNYDLLKSVPGIGYVTGIYLICCTANFSNKVSGKQPALYAGLAPFANTSGSSIKVRIKNLKKGVSSPAVSAIKKGCN